MARFSILAVTTGIATVLLRTTLARPFEHPDGWVPGHYRPLWNHETTTYHTTANTLTSTSTSTAASSTSNIHTTDVGPSVTGTTTAISVQPTGIFSSILPSSSFALPVSSALLSSDVFSISSVASSNTSLPGSTILPSGEVLPSSSILFSSSLASPASSLPPLNTSIATTPPISSATGIPSTGFIPSSSLGGTGIPSASSLSFSIIPGPSQFPPTGIIPTGIPQSSSQSFFPSFTGIPPTGIFPTGTASGTGLPLPSSPPLAAREAHALALHKRRAFEGPRHSAFPHCWPAAVGHWHGDATPVPDGSVISFVGGTTVSGVIIGGTVTIVPGAEPTGTAATCVWDTAATTGFVCPGAAGPWPVSWTAAATGTATSSGWLSGPTIGTGVVMVPIESTSMSSSI